MIAAGMAVLAAAAAVAAYLLGRWGAAVRVAGDHRRLRRSVRSLLGRGRQLLGLPLPAEDPDEEARALDRLGAALEAYWRSSEEERRRLAAVLAGLTEGIVLLDRYGRVLLANEAARQLWPRLETRLRGLHQIELFQDAALDGAVSRAMATGRPEAAEFVRPGPPRRYFRVRALPLPPERAPLLESFSHSGPGAAGLVLVVQDVTDMRAAEQMRRDFVANVSHELQTPLTSIRGYAETLLEGDVDEADRQRFLQHILRESERMAALARDLLALAQLEAAPLRPGIPVRLDRVAADVCESFAAQAAERGLALETDLAPARVVGRDDELARAVANLVQNALVYTPRGGRVRVRTWEEAGRAHLEVDDTGIGIPPEALPRIFERFYRVDPGRSRQSGGTGLGLAIVKHTVEGHGGRVDVESRVGQGSAFRITLPSAAEDPADDPPGPG